MAPPLRQRKKKKEKKSKKINNGSGCTISNPTPQRPPTRYVSTSIKPRETVYLEVADPSQQQGQRGHDCDDGHRLNELDHALEQG